MEEIQNTEIVKYSKIIRKVDQITEYDLFEVEVTFKDGQTKMYNIYT